MGGEYLVSGHNLIFCRDDTFLFIRCNAKSVFDSKEIYLIAIRLCEIRIVAFPEHFT